MMRRAALACACAVGAIVEVGAQPAAAYDGQLGLWAAAGYSGIVGDTPLPPHAVHFGLGGTIGIEDVWELRVRLDYAFHLARAHRTSVSLDLVYLVDVLSVVPYLGVGVGLRASVQDEDRAALAVRADLLAGAVLGLDVLLSRDWTVGFEIRPTFVPTGFESEPALFSALARAQALLEL